MASLLLVACVMSLIQKEMKGAAQGLWHKGCNILFRFCQLCKLRCCNCLIAAQTMQHCHVSGSVLFIPWCTLNSTSFPDGKLFLLIYVFTFHSLNIHAWDQCGWQTQYLHACVHHTKGPWGYVCSAVRDTQRGQITWMVKWESSTACTQKGLFCSTLDTKGYRRRRVWNPSHSCQLGTMISYIPPLPAPESLLISSLQSCARVPFVYSSFQWCAA